MTLFSKVILLEEIPIYTNGIEEVNPKKADFILDYELSDDNILELLSNNNLVVINKRQPTYITKTLSNSENIIKDPSGSINLVTNKYVYKIKIQNNIRCKSSGLSFSSRRYFSSGVSLRALPNSSFKRTMRRWWFFT